MPGCTRRADLPSPAARRVPGKIVFETSNVEPHELRAYEVLRAHGHSFRVLAVDPAARARGLSSLDIEMYGSFWELKCPRGSNAKKTIGRNINKAVEQFKNAGLADFPVRIVISALEVDISIDETVYRVEKKLREGTVDELILILSEIDVHYYKKNAEIPIALLRQTGGCLRSSHDTTYGVTEQGVLHEEAEIPIALLSQTGGCLRMVEYSTSLAGDAMQGAVRFNCARMPQRVVRYAARRSSREDRAQPQFAGSGGKCDDR